MWIPKTLGPSGHPFEVPSLQRHGPGSLTWFTWKSAPGKSEIPNLETKSIIRFHELNLGGGNLSKKSMCLLFCFLLVCSSTVLWRQQTLVAKSGKLDDVHIFLVSKGMILAIQTGQWPFTIAIHSIFGVPGRRPWKTIGCQTLSWPMTFNFQSPGP